MCVGLVFLHYPGVTSAQQIGHSWQLFADMISSLFFSVKALKAVLWYLKGVREVMGAENQYRLHF